MRIGITGHINVTPASVPVVAAELHKVLSGYTGQLVGVSCLARGADQVFARVVLQLGGDLEVLVPAADYRERKVEPDNHAEYDALVRRAATVRVLPFDRSNRDADGRLGISATDSATSSNGAPTKLFHNASTRPTPTECYGATML